VARLARELARTRGALTLRQTAVFHFNRERPREIVSLIASDGERLVDALHEQVKSASELASLAASSAAGKVEAGLRLGESAPIELSVGEEDAVFEAVSNLRADPEFSGPLEKLERILRERIEREHGGGPPRHG
jgi:hypothetical protein